MNDYIIIGCGISGLYVANKLSNIGLNVLLFDKRHEVYPLFPKDMET